MLSATGQEDFSAGIARGRKAPPNAVYDATNMLIGDDGLLFRRGGSAYHTTSDASIQLVGVAAPYLPAASAVRVLTWGTSTRVVSSGTPVTTLTPAPTDRRPVVVGDRIVFGSGSAAGNVQFYGGSLLGTIYNTGTVTVTNGSKTVTGAGTSWSGANVDPGTMFVVGGAFGIVKSVTNTTSFELLNDWGGASAGGASYTLTPGSSLGISDIASISTAGNYVAAAGAGAPRLIVGTGNRAYFTERGVPETIDATTYHEMPAGSQIIGAEGIGDSCLIFTTVGVWRIDNLSLDPVDSFGNIQHSVQRINSDVILWSDAGIVGWSSGVILPARDDVIIFGGDGSVIPLTGTSENEKVRRLYRQYVAAGYQPGYAAVHRGHYFLPILNGTTWVDTLVCRLDRGAAWTRWDGHAACRGYAAYPSSAGLQPKLLGTAGLRVADLTGCFTPVSGNSADADASNFTSDVISRDYATGANQHGFVQRVRARYELTDGGTPDPAVAIAFSSDQDAGTFTTLTETGGQGGTAGWGASDGSSYSWALVGKRRERIRFRIRVTGAAASFVLRSLELLLRPTGKQ